MRDLLQLPAASHVMIYVLGAVLFVFVHLLIYIGCRAIDPYEEMRDDT